MSSAFVKEGEPGHLKDVAPNLGSLLFFLRVDYGGMVIRENKVYFNEKHHCEVHELSDGLTYGLGHDGRWQIILD